MAVRDAASRRDSKNNNRGDAAQTTRTTGGGASSGEESCSNLINFVKSFSNKEDGQDLLEYALLVALIALIAIGAVGLAGGSVSDDLHGDRWLARRRGVVVGAIRCGARRPMSPCAAQPS